MGFWYYSICARNSHTWWCRFTAGHTYIHTFYLRTHINFLFYTQNRILTVFDLCAGNSHTWWCSFAAGHTYIHFIYIHTFSFYTQNRILTVFDLCAGNSHTWWCSFAAGPKTVRYECYIQGVWEGGKYPFSAFSTHAYTYIYTMCTQTLLQK